MKEYFKQLRNWFHVEIGVNVGYILTFVFGFTNRENYPLTWNDFRTLLGPIAGAIAVVLAAAYWEYRQDKISAHTSDKRDIFTSGISAYIGGVISLFAFNWYVAIAMTILSAYLVVYKRDK
jgi:phosphotransferase system  glucose/maltose/N-acetylglucosamine-specific IIC component